MTECWKHNSYKDYIKSLAQDKDFRIKYEMEAKAVVAISKLLDNPREFLTKKIIEYSEAISKETSYIGMYWNLIEWDIKRLGELVKYVDKNLQNDEYREYLLYQKGKTESAILFKETIKFCEYYFKIIVINDALLSYGQKKEAFEDFLTEEGRECKEKIYSTIIPILYNAKDKQVAKVIQALIIKRYLQLSHDLQKILNAMKKEFNTAVKNRRGIDKYLNFDDPRYLEQKDCEDILELLP